MNLGSVKLPKMSSSKPSRKIADVHFLALHRDRLGEIEELVAKSVELDRFLFDDTAKLLRVFGADGDHLRCATNARQRISDFVGDRRRHLADLGQTIQPSALGVGALSFR